MGVASPCCGEWGGAVPTLPAASRDQKPICGRTGAVTLRTASQKRHAGDAVLSDQRIQFELGAGALPAVTTIRALAAMAYRFRPVGRHL